MKHRFAMCGWDANARLLRWDGFSGRGAAANCNTYASSCADTCALELKRMQDAYGTVLWLGSFNKQYLWEDAVTYFCSVHRGDISMEQARAEFREAVKRK